MGSHPGMVRPARVLAGLGLLALLGQDTTAQANGSNFSLLHNGLDVVYTGLGAGGGALASDGIGTWVPGEDMKGPRMTVLGDWGHRNVGITENVCVLGPDPGPGGTIGGLAILFANVAMVELDGRNGHRPDVFTAPTCTSAGIPGLTSAGIVPYGVPTTAGVLTPSASFLLVGYPSGIPGLPSSGLVLPNNGLFPSGHGGTATLIANTGLAGLPITSTGFCWTVNFNWLPSALASLDDVDGWWHYAHTSPDLNQYWGMSDNEMNTWQSFSVARVGSGLTGFAANLEYAFVMTSSDPQTLDALQPAAAGGGVYYTTTVGAGGGNPGAPGSGFDLGRHGAWSQSGLGGVPGPSGTGNQDPANGPFPTAIPTVGFATFNNRDYAMTGSPSGGFRLLWLELDWDAFLGIDPALAGDAALFGGSVRVPAPIPTIGAWPQPLTIALFPLLVHDTAPNGWPNPYGSGGPVISGTSVHLPLVLGPVCIGAPVALTYGSSGLLGPGGPLTWDPTVNAASGTKQLYYLD